MAGVTHLRLDLAALVVLASASLWAAPAPQLLVEAPPELEAVAREVRALENDDFSEVLLLTGTMGFAKPIRVVLAPESSPLAREMPAWVSGYAVGRESTVVLFPARVRSYPDRNLRTLVHHEVAHVLVAHVVRGRAVPRWFNEGVATVAAREWGLEDRARFAAAVLGRSARSAADLDRAFAGTDSEVHRAYALSAAFVRFIQQRWGALAPAEILRGVARGLEFEEAFLMATGVRLSEAEHVFFKKDAFWNTWVPFLTSTGALWMAVTLLALVAIHRRRARSRKMIEEWDADEEAEFGQATHDGEETVN